MKTLYLCLLTLLFVPLVHADSFTLNLNMEFSGATPPAGTSPWITATFEDVLGGVQLTINGANLVGTEKMTEFAFNLDPALDPNNLTFGFQSGQAATTISTDTNAFKADGDGFFDVLFEYANGGANQFTSGETSVYLLSGIAGLDVNDFKFASVNGPANKTGFYAAAHIQSIGTSGNGSGWIAPSDPRNPPQGQVPEPSSVLLLGTMVGAVAHLVWKRRTA